MTGKKRRVSSESVSYGQDCSWKGGNRGQERQTLLALGTKHIYSSKEAGNLKTLWKQPVCTSPEANGQTSTAIWHKREFRSRTEAAKYFKKIIINSFGTHTQAFLRTNAYPEISTGAS